MANSQPKLEDAEYVESQGFLVPHRSPGFEEAMEAGDAFFMRSEHAQDRAGASGILESPLVDPTNFSRFQGSLDAFRESVLRQSGVRQANAVEEYCRLMGIPLAQFLSEVSYSYWQKLGGWNHSVVADSAVQGRYHVFTSGKPHERNYSIFDQGTIRSSHGFDQQKDAIQRSIPTLIEWYEKIRSLPRFDATHCPIIEAQTCEGEHYFLQYHLTRDFEPSTFTLDRSPEQGEIESVFVRGATPREGLIVQTAIYYPDEPQLIGAEEGALDLPMNFVFSEIMARLRRVCLLKHTPMDGLASETRPAHTLLSSLFKPGVSTVLGEGFHTHLTEDLMDRVFRETQSGGIPVRVPFKVTSDGRRAFVKFMG